MTHRNIEESTYPLSLMRQLQRHQRTAQENPEPRTDRREDAVP